MNQEQHTIQRAFSGWKMFVAIGLGIVIAAWMVWNSLQEVDYISVQSGGTHRWVDLNRDGKKQIPEFQLSSNGNFRQQKVSDVIQQIKWDTQSYFWLFLALICMFGRDLFYMIRIRVLTQKKLTWNASFQTIMLWEFASALSPGVVGGSAVAMFILHREKIPLGRSTAIVVITAMMDNLFYVLMIPFVFLFLSPSTLFPSNSGSNLSVEWVFWIGFTAIAFVCFLLFLSIFYYPKLIGRFLSFLFRLPFLKKARNKAIQTGVEIETTSLELRNEPWKFWFSSFGATLGSWISRYLVINCLLAAFLNLSFFDHFFVLGKQLVLWLFMLISPTPGASGVAEYAFGELMSPFTESALLLAGLAVIWRLISYFPYLFIGALILPRWLRKSN